MRQFFTILALLLWPTLARAQTAQSAVVSDDIFLEGKHISLGISGTGSFGTASNAPAGFNKVTGYNNIGLSIDQDGFGTGAAATTGDFFLPGTKEEGFTVGFKRVSTSGTASNFTNAELNSKTDLTQIAVANTSSGNNLEAVYVGKTSDDRLRVRQVISFGLNDKFFKTSITLANITTETLYSVRYMRSFDPDQDKDLNALFTTTNEVVENPSAGDSRAIVKAVGPTSGVPFFFVSFDSRARASRFGFANRDVYATAAYDTPTAKGTTATTDEGITMTFDVGNVAIGDSVTVVFYSSLDLNFSTSLSAIQSSSQDSNGSLAASATVSEPVALPSTANAAASAVNIFDFTLGDGGGDSKTLDVSQVVLHTSGTGPLSQVVFRLNGPDASNVTGTYSSGANTLTFSGLSISVAESGSETYTVNAYYSANTGLTEGQTFILSVDGDTDLTVGSSNTLMGTTSAISKGTGSTVSITATQLVFATQPAGATHGVGLTTQPTVAVRDAVGNVDSDYSGTVVLSISPSGTLTNNSAGLSSGVANFSNLSISGVGSGRTLSAALSGFSSVTSTSFDVAKASATVTFTSLRTPYNGEIRSAVAVTDPIGLNVSLSYSPSPPFEPGQYAVTATTDEANYQGSASATLVIESPGVPVPLLAATPLRGRQPLTVRYNASASGFARNYVLELFDGPLENFKYLHRQETTSAPAALSHTYQQPGTYDAVLTVSGPGGQAQVRVSVIVEPQPVPPVLSGVVAARAFDENAINRAAAIPDDAVELSDADSPDFDGGTLTVSYASGGGREDQLKLASGDGVELTDNSVRYQGVAVGVLPTSGAGSGRDGESLVIAFNAAATAAVVDALIEKLSYQNTSDDPAASRTLAIAVHDGDDGGTSTAVLIEIAVLSEADAVPRAFINSFVGGGPSILDGAVASATRLNFPFGLFVAGDGTLYIADTNNQRIRKVDAEGIVTTVAGSGQRGFGGDGGPATRAQTARSTRNLRDAARRDLYRRHQ